MSALTDLIGQTVSSTINSVIVDSEFLPGPITLTPGASGSTSSSSNSAIGAILKPSIQVLDANGNQVYAAAPYGAVQGRAKAFALMAVVGVAGFFAVYGAVKFFKK